MNYSRPPLTRGAARFARALAMLALLAGTALPENALAQNALAQNALAQVRTKAEAQAALQKTLSFANARVLIPGTSLGGGMYTLAKSYRQRALQEGEYEKGAIYIKTRERFVLGKGASTFQSSVLMSSLEGANVRTIKPLSPQHNSGRLLASDDLGIGRIYEVQFEKAVDVQRLCKELAKNSEIEYAEPIPIHKLLQTDRVRPRDPLYGSQYQWRLIEAERAWAITRGDTNVVIAICDSGVDLEHEDLRDKIWNNPGETGNDASGRDKRSNGVDDDGNGRIDDWRGWDFIGNSTIAEINSGVFRTDNNTTPRPRRGLSDDNDVFEGLNHGIHVAGIAAATTDNDKGGAGSGFLCRILPIKNATDDPGAPNSVIRGYEGILYAAQMGAKVVNCSWGGLGTYNQTLQDIVNTATNMGTLVVAAAGNDGSLMDDDYFPGSYDNIMSVGASNSSDVPAGFSNFGIKTTVFAPGDDILSTFGEGKYGTIGGTSMASPMAAGIAALVRTLHPDWTPRQVAQQIRTTSDNVLQPGSPTRPINFFGRMNAYKALNINRTLNATTGELTPGIIVASSAVNARNGVIGDFEPKRLILSLRNILSNANDVSVTLQPLDPFIIALQPTVTLGALNTNEQKEVEFSVQLQSAALTAVGIDVTEFVAIIRSGSYINYERVSMGFQVPVASAVPGLVVSPVVNFGTTPLPTNATVRISNTGNQGLTVSNATFTGANAGEFSLVTPIDNVQIGGGEFITRQVRFTPTTGATGSRTANLNITAISDGKSTGGGAPISGGYTFSGAAAPYQEITSTTSPFTRLGAGLDDEEFDVQLGFPFQFGTKTYTSVKVVSNGWLAFAQTGSSIDANSFIDSPISDARYTAEGIVSACGLDIFMQNDGTITSETQGTAPNRVFVVQWKRASFVDNPYAAGADADLNFQIRLYETSNRIELRYGKMEFTRGPAFALPVQVGLRGTTPSDYNNRRVGLADNNTWATSVPGTAANDLCRINPVYAPPASGYVYTYTPGDFAALATPRVVAFTRTAQLNATARTGGFLGTLPSIAAGVEFGAVTIGTTRVLTTTFANYSPNPMTISALEVINFAEVSPTEFAFVDAPTLPLVLPPNSTRTLQVRYTPTTPDNVSLSNTISPVRANVRITHDGVTALLPLRGTGIARDYNLRVFLDNGLDLTGNSISASRVDRLPPFPAPGTTAPLPPENFSIVGQTRTIRQFSVRNVGTAPITVTGGTFVLVTNSNAVSTEFILPAAQFPFTVQPSTQQTLTIQYTPTQTGEKWVEMRIFSENAAPAVTRMGSRGALPSAIVVTAVQRDLNTILGSTPQGFRFPMGAVATNTSATRTFALRNSSTSATMTISTIAFIGANGGDFTIEGLTLPTILATSATTSVIVRFRPGGEGLRTAQMTLSQNLNYGVEAVEVWGTGIAAKRLIVPTGTLVLATTEPNATSNTISVNLNSTGRETVRLTSLRFIGKDADQFKFQRQTPDGTTIATLRSSTATIFFAPTSAGVKEARLMVTSDAEFPVQYVELRGLSENVPAVATIATLDATIAMGSEIEIPIVLRNARRLVPGTKLYATLRMNATVAVPIIGTMPQGQVIDGQRIIPLTFDAPASAGGAGDVVLQRLRFRTVLGNDTTTALRLEGVFSPNANLTATSGRLNITDAPRAFIHPDTLVRYTGQQGETIEIPLQIRNRQNIPQDSPMLVSLNFNASMLEPTNIAGVANISTSVANGFRGISITVQRDATTPNTTIPIRLRAAIGNASETPITLSNYISIGYPNGLLLNQLGARFTMTRLNQAGGTQLFFSSKKSLQITQTTPNPTTDAASVAFVLRTESAMSLSVSNSVGTVVREENLGTLKSGDHTARVLLGGLPSGSYLLTLRSATEKETVTIQIVR
jgi:hypothetical protein